jgi:hypothetical protein
MGTSIAWDGRRACHTNLCWVQDVKPNLLCVVGQGSIQRGTLQKHQTDLQFITASITMVEPYLHLTSILISININVEGRLGKKTTRSHCLLAPPPPRRRRHRHHQCCNMGWTPLLIFWLFEYFWMVWWSRTYGYMFIQYIIYSYYHI